MKRKVVNSYEVVEGHVVFKVGVKGGDNAIEGRSKICRKGVGVGN